MLNPYAKYEVFVLNIIAPFQHSPRAGCPTALPWVRLIDVAFSKVGRNPSGFDIIPRNHRQN